MVYTIDVTPEADYAGDVTVSVSADAAADGNGIGNTAASETFAVDTKAPGFQSAAVTGNTLVLTYDEDLDEGSPPDASAYTVMAGPAADALTTAALAGGPGDGVGQDRDADAGEPGNGGSCGSGELHGTGERFEAAGRAGQRGGGPGGHGRRERHGEADGDDRERCEPPDEGRVRGDDHLLGGRDRVPGIRGDGGQGRGGGVVCEPDGDGLHDRRDPGRRTTRAT